MQSFRFSLFLLLGILTLSLSSCSLIGDIFRAGACAGIVGVGLIASLVLFLVSEMRRGRSA